jgi:uncharacterized protein YecE (DUF72 family)
VTIHIGTCSWSHKSLNDSGRFYPADVKSPEARLRFYASMFPTVEVDTSFYGIPTEQTALQWVDRTPDEFTFHIKAFRLLTLHWSDLKMLPPELRGEATPHAGKGGRLYLRDLPPKVADALWATFEQAMRPLHAARKLGSVLFQFPPWVTPNKAVYAHIKECKERLADYQLTVEFRNKAWFSQGLEEALGFLREQQIVYAAVDEPQGFPSSVPPIVDVTGPGAYVRFHGRNHEMWEAKVSDSSERFNWWYTDEELAEWVPKIEFLEREAGNVTALFNTNWEDQGQQNARRLAQVLAAHGLGSHVQNHQAILDLPARD